MITLQQKSKRECILHVIIFGREIKRIKPVPLGRWFACSKLRYSHKRRIMFVKYWTPKTSLTNRWSLCFLRLKTLSRRLCRKYTCAKTHVQKQYETYHRSSIGHSQRTYPLQCHGLSEGHWQPPPPQSRRLYTSSQKNMTMFHWISDSWSEIMYIFLQTENIMMTSWQTAWSIQDLLSILH